MLMSHCRVQDVEIGDPHVIRVTFEGSDREIRARWVRIAFEWRRRFDFNGAECDGEGIDKPIEFDRCVEPLG